ncbi:metallophosphoesterase [Winogradskyella sp. UBA3174]|uniref:metallophosphoesterase n=1 Tax=Winogradskyella sp. UBA3174 TaxID=1947785 RepID=UPI0025FE26DC|nr:metallophosphoesterase [Winogradskyella sp. UBA3174]|tara:strand:- start:45253 stop:48957 length:3705 start_codon:yes stop_codon:yes gene_type:complete
MNFLRKCIILFAILFLFNACATLKKQISDGVEVEFPTNKEISHSFYLIGDAGNSLAGETDQAIKDFENALNKASFNSTAIFLGDNIYPKGFTDKKSESKELAEHRLKVQIDAAKKYKGNTIFIPGNHDWYSGLKGLKKQEKFVEDALGKNTFLPENGCPIEKVKISDDVVLLIIDSHWYITNWDNHPTINDDCDIKTRVDFLSELGSQIKKARGKTTLIAMHHPMFNNGSHGGQYSFKSHMKPLPVIGTLKNLAKKTGGVINVDLQNKMYNELKNRVVTLAQQNDKVVFVSGHEHNLQYLVEAGLPQIISGSGSKISAARLIGNGQFAYGVNGYTRLDVFKDGSSFVRFYEAGTDEVVFKTEVLKPNKNKDTTSYPKDFPREKVSAIYTEEEIDVSGFHNFLWGDRYRKQFGTKVMVPTVSLDTLFGGVVPVRKGGGNQSKSLRLEDKNGRQYVMRALKKQASRYLQAIMFKDQYIGDKLDDTFATNLLLDVFTGAHPYAPFIVGDLADAIGVYHTNPVLYYVPKQNALGDFNVDFGDELYMIEEHTSEGHDDKASFGYSNTLLSTEDMMKKIRKDEDIIIDEAAYIKARLFDMLIGDWDRHQDQWRWLEFKENGKKVYRPMPRDRDQAFSKMSDGFLLTTAIALVPTAGLLRKYGDDLQDVKVINVEPYPLDMELIERSDKTVWDAQVKLIQENVTDEIIEKAFLNVPQEVRDNDLEDIKKMLIARRGNLQDITNRYYEVINKFAVIKGTNKDDWFDIERMPNGITKVTGYRIKDDKKADIFHQRIYNKDETKEIWVYALDDDDVFNVFGEGDRLIKVRLVGGHNNDTYDIKNGKKVKFYDHKSKKNTILTKNGRQKITDDYESNVYNYKKLKNSTNQLLPSIGANPDDGFSIGIVNKLTNYNFERNPFSSQHTFSAGYYFATNGYDLGYKAEFANVIGSANLSLDVNFTSPNFARNFFGFGNSTVNPESVEDDGLDVNLDYNRVKIRTISVAPSLVWKGQEGSLFEVGVSYESNEVDRTSGRFLESITTADNNLFDKQNFIGAHAKYVYDVKDNYTFPTLGMHFGLEAGFKNNLSTSDGFGYIVPELGFNYKLVPEGQVVLATKLRSHINLGDDFEFYQAAVLGDQTGLRGYRRERFSGKQSFVQSTDLRFNLRRTSSNFLPFNIGFYGGFDYGRVWIDDSEVIDTAFNADKWNTSIGGGVFITAYSMFSANISAFSSDDGLRLGFRLGFGF